MAITWLADVLRGAGLTVVEHEGWKSRTAGGSWSPRFGIVHATAAPRAQADETQIRIVRDGRAGLRGPIANACVDRAGRWHVLAAGRCNTTVQGTAGPFDGQGNTYALGVEACNDNRGEAWPEVQYNAYARGWAAIAKRLGWSAQNLRGHKEHTPGHKTDPTFDMGAFRSRVQALLNGEDDMPTAEELWAHKVDGKQSAGGYLVTEGARSKELREATLPAMSAAIGQLATAVKELTGKDLVDEGVIVAGVLAGLDPAAIAAAVAAALPADQAQRVADELAARLAG